MDNPMTVPPPPGLTVMRPEVWGPVATAHDDNSTGWALRPVYGPHQVGRSSSCHNDEYYVQTRRRQEDYAAARAHDDDYEAVISFPTFRTGAEHPKARIQHGRAGDDILMRYYRKHDTFNGPGVYIEPNVCHYAAARAHDGYTLFVPKHHFMLHIPAQLAKFTMLIMCYVHERKHKILKRFYCKHVTFAGAMVYIKPNMDSEQED
jgi:hypothetical protein